MVAFNANVLYILGAWAFWGTYPVPFKTPAVVKADVDPFAFQCMKSAVVFITSWLVLTWMEFTFTFWGFVGAALWVPSGLFFIQGVKLSGVALTTPVANGCQVIVSFCWGALFFHEPVKNIGLSVLGMALMIAGMVGISFSVNYEKIRAAKHAGEETVPENGAVSVDINTSMKLSQENIPLLSTQVKPQQAQKLTFAKLRKEILGIGCALMVGLFGGSMNVPLKHAPASAHGLQYLISFGVGSVAVTTALTLIYVIIRLIAGEGLPTVNLRVSLLPGAAAGLLWQAGNVCQMSATLIYGQTIGYPLVMCNMMVAGCWGAFFYNEAPRPILKALFILSCVVVLGGVTLLSTFG